MGHWVPAGRAPRVRSMVLVFRWVVLLLCAVPLGVGAQTCERAIGSDECVATDAGSEEKLSRTASCDVFGTVGGRPRTREDVLINGTARVELDNGQCSLAYALPGQRVWLHIPKCASTWMRTHLHVDEDRHRIVDTEVARDISRGARMNIGGGMLRYETSETFAIVRDPTARVLSAYSTIVERGGNSECWREALPFLNEADEEMRFLGFLRALRDVGTRALGACPHVGYGCLWHHALSQSLFVFRAVGLPPLRRRNIVRLERLSTELPRVLDTPEIARLPLSVYAQPENTNANAGSRLLRIPGVLAFIAEYYRQDYACFGYPPPDLGGVEPTLWGIEDELVPRAPSIDDLDVSVEEEGVERGAEPAR